MEKHGVLHIHSHLVKKFPGIKTDHYHTDLYVKYSAEVWDWLRNHYERPQAISTFVAADNSGTWIEIPFAYNEDVKMLAVLKHSKFFEYGARKAAEEKNYKPKPGNVEYYNDPASGLTYATFDAKIYVKDVGVFNARKLRAFAEKVCR